MGIVLSVSGIVAGLGYKLSRLGDRSWYMFVCFFKLSLPTQSIPFALFDQLNLEIKATFTVVLDRHRMNLIVNTGS